MTKKRNILFALLSFALIAAYVGLWFYSANWFKREIDRAYTNADKNGVRFLGPKPILGNFPFVPEVRYEGGIQAGNALIEFPKMVLRGYPVPGMRVHISFPEGISLDGIANPAIWHLTDLSADIIVPYTLPRSLEYDDMLDWKNRDGKIDIRRYRMVKDELQAEGNGLLTIDTDLQPVFHLDSTIRDYELFIQSQIDKGLIEPFPGAIGMTILNRFSHIDQKTKEKTVTMTVSVENRMLTVGPLQVLQLPEIVWDKHSSPGLRL